MIAAFKYKLSAGLIIIGTLIFISCNTTKYVPKNKYFLNSVQVKIDNKDINQDDILGYIKQKANKKILGIRFYLDLYNLSNPQKTKGLSNYLRTIGEEPAIWDKYTTEETKSQLKIFLDKMGYYNSEVSDTLLYHKQKVDLIYFIKTKQPYIIRNITYDIPDTNVRALVLADTSNSFLKPGSLADKNVMEKERTDHLVKQMKDNGYMYFNFDNISIDMDTSYNHKVDLLIHIHNMEQKINNNLVTSFHKKYVIRKVTIINENITGESEAELKDIPYDTIHTNGFDFLYKKKYYVKPSVILQSCYILPGSYYSASEVDKTRKYLYDLKTFNTVDVRFNDVSSDSTLDGNYVDCKIKLITGYLQSHNTELEGTNSSGNIGGAISMVYQHNSLFGGAEIFKLKLKWAMEAIKQTDVNRINKTTEYGAEASIDIPKFLLPVNTIKFVKKYNPSTSITLAYNFQERPDYTRRIANTSFGYLWEQGKYNTHYVVPIEINLVDIPYISDSYASDIAGTYLEKSYTNHLVTVSRYSFIYNSQNINKQKDFTYFKLNAESAGSILYAINSIASSKKTDGYYTLFSKRYSQFLKADIDFRHFQMLSSNNTFAYRFFAGVAYPYGNAVAVPFEKQYFSGGANSIRGWAARTLGPGSYNDTISQYPNSTGDIKLEANIEYRYKLFWLVHGALFTDVGNVWAITKSDERQGALFKFNKFYKDLAVASGFGLRFDFRFFWFRTDLGLKMRNPVRTSNLWVFQQKKLLASDFAICVAINMPF